MTQTKAELLQTRHQGDLKLGDADSSHYVGFKAPATVGSNLVWTLPATDGSANQFLQTNASGVLGWGTADVSSAMPLSGGTFTGDVTFDGATAGRDIVFDRSDNALEFADHAKATFGNSADISIYHNGYSYIEGELRIGKNNNVRITDANDDTRLQVTNTGIAVTGAATISTNLTVTGDLTVSGTTTTINTQTLDVEDKNVVIGKVSSPSDTTADGGGWTLKGATDKTWNWVNATDAWTSSEHINIPDNKKLLVGTSSDLEIYHSGSDSFIHEQTKTLILKTTAANKGTYLQSNDTVWITTPAAGETMAKFIKDGAVELYHNNVKKFETYSNGINVSGRIQFTDVGLTDVIEVPDGKKITVGSSGDCSLYHDATHTYLDNTTGDLRITDTGGGGIIIASDSLDLRNSARDEKYFTGTANGAVELFHNNVKKIETTATGINVTGQINVNGSALSAAPEITATANGSITANEAVIVEADGKVAGITGFTFGEGSAASFTGTGGGGYSASVFAADRANGNQGLLLYQDVEAANRWQLKVVTFSGTSVTYNTKVQVSGATAGGQAAICNVSSGVYVIMYNATSFETVRVVTVSGSGSSATITMGSGLSFNESGNNNCHSPELQFMRNTSDKVIFAYHDYYNGSGEGRVLTISGTGGSASISTSGQTRFNSNRPYNMKSTYDTTNNVMVVTYTQGSSTSGTDKIHAFKLDGSGNFTAGNVQSAYSFSSGGVDVIYDSINNMIYSLVQNNGNNYRYIKSMQYNSSNNYYTALGSGQSLNDSYSNSSERGSERLGFDPVSGNIAVFFIKNNTLYMDYGKTNSNNYLDLTSSPITVTSSVANYPAMVQTKGVLSNGRIPLIYNQDSNSDGVIRVRQFAGTDLTTENFIGFAAAGYSNGATATIKVTGNTTTSSSLTPGQKYFLQNDGTLALTAADPSVVGGRALTSTTLLINTGA